MRPPPRSRRGDGPQPLGGSLEALTSRLGIEGPGALGRLFSEWAEIVGPAMAEHVRPQRLDAEALVVVVDHPAWATQVRRLADTLLDRVTAHTGVERPGRLDVRVHR